MKLENKSKKGFEITFNGETHDIPVGEFEVTDRDLGLFIADTATKWGFDVEITEDILPKTEVKPQVKTGVKQTEKPKEETPKTAQKATGASTETVPKK